MPPATDAYFQAEAAARAVQRYRIEGNDVMTGNLLMVIPSTVRLVDGVYEVERDYANNLRIYLKNFSHVTFACPVSPSTAHHILRSQPITQIEDSTRLTYLPLPVAYREE